MRYVQFWFGIISTQVNGQNVIQLILQFLQEHGFTRAASLLQDEAKVRMKSVNHSTLSHDIRSGDWSGALRQLSTIQMDDHLLFDIHEQIFLELLEKGERDICARMLGNSSVFGYMRKLDTISNVRYQRLEVILRETPVNSDLYKGESKSARRDKLVQEIISKIPRSIPSRLLTLIQNGLRFEINAGLLPKGSSSIDLLTGDVRTSERSEAVLSSRKGRIILPKGSIPEAISFSPDGTQILVGSSDGLIEVYDIDSCGLSMSMTYQARGEFMVHKSAITALTFSATQDLIGSGDKDGGIRLWDFNTGRLVREFNPSHTDAITSLEFFQDNLLTSSLDKTSRIYGTKSGRLLQEFKAHDCLINAATWFNDGSKVLTGCSSGEVIAFSRSTGTPIQAFTIVRTYDTLGDPSVRGIRVIQSETGTYTLMIYTLRDAHETTADGKLIQSFRSGDADTYIGCDISPTGSTVYLATERGVVHVFNRKSGELIRELRASERGLTGIRLSEAGLLLAVSSLDGKIDLFGK